ncbi:MAG: cation:proton antiporter [Candidatus Micrarchaeia archaeon]|jgi:Kef-type K+ transport system membrane component KefB
MQRLEQIERKFLKPVVFLSIVLLFLMLLFSLLRTSIFYGTENPEEHAIFEIVFLLLLAIVAESVVVYLKQPTVLVLLLLGIVMGPSFIGEAWGLLHPLLPFLPAEAPTIVLNTHLVDVFAQLGAIILMYKVGLHSSISRIFSGRNFIIAFLGIILPFFAGYAFAIYSGGGFVYALFLGAALTATSVGVTVALLKEAKLVDADFAQAIIGAAVIDDILSLLVLSLVLNMPSSFDPAALQPFGLTLASAIIFMVGGVYAGKWFIGTRIDKKEMSDKRFLYALAFVFFYAYFAEFIGLSSIVGAFLAGLLLNYSRHREEIEKRSYALEILFTPIFFISLGMLVDVPSLYQYAVPILLITVIAIITKVLGCGLGAFLTGFRQNSSALIGIGMSPRGEVALIVALIGFTAGALTQSEYSIISAMAFLTAIVTPPLMAPFLKGVE